MEMVDISGIAQDAWLGPTLSIVGGPWAWQANSDCLTCPLLALGHLSLACAGCWGFEVTDGKSINGHWVEL